MSYSFDGSTAYMNRTASVPATAVPCTIAGWIKLNSVSVSETVCTLVNNSSLSDYFSNRVNSSGFANAQHRTVSNGNFSANESSSLSTATWTHVCAVFASGTSRSIYVNGGSKVTDTNTVGAFNLVPNEIRLGSRPGGTAEYLNGLLAHIAVWNMALADADVTNLQTQVPSSVQSGNLRAYYPLTDNQGTSAYNDATANGYNLTINAATYSTDNPTVGSAIANNRMLLTGVG